MSKHQTGSKNGMWRGGKSIASNGYVLIRVGSEHHLADVRGYAYEHRIVAEKKIRRRLRKGEVVHHLDGDKRNNRPENLAVHSSSAHHKQEHRGPLSERRRVGQKNQRVRCACGCGALFLKFDREGRQRRFVSGHNLENVGCRK